MAILAAVNEKEQREHRFTAALNGIDLGRGRDQQPEERIDEYEAASFGLGFSSEGEG